mgnify:CR=1 FL=1
MGELLEARLRAAERPFNAVMIERLGPNVWHQTLDQAMALLEELEQTFRQLHAEPAKATATPAAPAPALGA